MDGDAKLEVERDKEPEEWDIWKVLQISKLIWIKIRAKNGFREERVKRLVANQKPKQNDNKLHKSKVPRRRLR